MPFDKEELTAILKFGADELFKSGDGSGSSEDKALQELDIDDILSRAETQATTDNSSHNDLLSQFKMTSFAMDEEDMAPPPSATPTEGKAFVLGPRVRGKPAMVERSWEELIPEEARKKMDEEEKTKEQLDLYLPPRQRKVRVSGAVQCARSERAWFRVQGARMGGPAPERDGKICLFALYFEPQLCSDLCMTPLPFFFYRSLPLLRTTVKTSSRIPRPGVAELELVPRLPPRAARGVGTPTSLPLWWQRMCEASRTRKSGAL